MNEINYFLSNREVVKNLSLNTGTTASPVFTAMGTTAELKIVPEFEEKDFYVFCDAIKRSIITGAKLTIEGTVKIDAGNAAIVSQLTDLKNLITEGTVAQYNNQIVQAEIISGVEDSVLTYTKYQLPCTIQLGEMGGAAEDEGAFEITITLNGKGSVVVAPAN